MLRKFFQFFSLVLLSLNILVWGLVFKHLQKPDIEVYFFDVGQGDSHLIESKDGTQILIDGGPPNKILSRLSAVLDFDDRHIDALVLSHPHADHVSGLIEILKNYEVDYVFESGVGYDTPEAKEFRALASKKTIVVDKPINLNFFRGAKLRLLHPDKSFAGKTPSHVHDSMVVAELVYNPSTSLRARKILFAGDMEKNLEHYLVKKGEISDIDILKVGHQGSKTSSSEKFLDFAKPEYSVVPVGKNSYGHPNPDVLSRLASIGSKIFRTDQDGTVKFEIDSLGKLKFFGENVR
ncbi:MAG: MBL fold metallo-hydrolase [Patescibacteria group bacterium]